MAPKSEKSQGERKPGEERPQLLSEQGGYGHDKKGQAVEEGAQQRWFILSGGKVRKGDPAGDGEGHSAAGGRQTAGEGRGSPRARLSREPSATAVTYSCCHCSH